MPIGNLRGLLLAPALLVATAAGAFASSSSVTVTSGGGRSEAHTSSGATANTSGAAALHPGGGAASEESVRKVLREQGFTDVEDIKRDGTRFTARAKKDGQSVNVELSTSSLGDDRTR